MARQSNPFEELYVSETVPPKHFVRLFSPFLVNHAKSLFQPGNVVLRGVQGSGKTMLLSLLKPAIRLAYAEAGVEFPVPEDCRRFVGAGINLRRHGFMDFGQRRFELDSERNAEQFPIFFGDFLNYSVVENLLQSLDTFRKRHDGLIASQLDIVSDERRWDEFAQRLAADRCWFGAMDGIATHAALRNALRARIGTYLGFLNYNIDEVPEALRRSKTRIGVPIARVASALWHSGVVPQDVQFFVRIDQYEELGRLAPVPLNPEHRYQQVVNKALGTRDSHVSYRVGVRRHEWRDNLTIHGTPAMLEGEREYNVLDLDEMLRRKENRKSWIFGEFAADVMHRRLEFANYDVGNDCRRLLATVFMQNVSPATRADMYVRNSRSDTRFLKMLPEWSGQWKEKVTELAAEDVLSAKLATAWLQQRKGKNAELPVPEKPPYPWDRQYWRKERIQQALMQIAARAGQRMIWAGSQDVLRVSGGNILVFVSVCRSVWAAWIRASRLESPAANPRIPLPTIDAEAQTVGIHIASELWFEKIVERPGGSTRQRFLNNVARRFQKALAEDDAMSYPGHNGFSLAVDDVSRSTLVRDFLRDAVDYGDLVDAAHTTKESDRRARTKWYLAPILSPFFKLPATHVKEPIYLDPSTVAAWIEDAIGDTGDRPANSDHPETMTVQDQDRVDEAVPLSE